MSLACLKRRYMGELSSLLDISFSTTSKKFCSERGCRASIFRKSLSVLTGETERKGRFCGADDFRALEVRLAPNSGRCYTSLFMGVGVSISSRPGGELARASSSPSIFWHIWKCGSKAVEPMTLATSIFGAIPDSCSF